jgi:hypothetical protein
MSTTSKRSTHTSDLQRQVSWAMWDRKRAATDRDPLGVRRAERRIAELLDEFAESVLVRLSLTPIDRVRTDTRVKICTCQPKTTESGQLLLGAGVTRL